MTRPNHRLHDYYTEIRAKWFEKSWQNRSKFPIVYGTNARQCRLKRRDAYMSRQPTLKQLKYLCALAQHQHFGNAAKACHVSQSTLSASIVELEDVLSISLVERNNRAVLLTAVGQEVVERRRRFSPTSTTLSRYARLPESHSKALSGWVLFPRLLPLFCRRCSSR